MKPIAGKFEILRIEIGGVTMSLREILFGFIQEDFDERGIDYEVPDFTSVRDNKKLIKDMMMAFNPVHIECWTRMIPQQSLEHFGTKH
jgi:hypothetical protein